MPQPFIAKKQLSRKYLVKSSNENRSMKKPHVLSAFIVTLFSCALLAQTPQKPHIGEIQQMINKLDVLGSVLYVAAHPDDENTSLITYYANEEHMRTAYLSATRGDGGQNLIGPEIKEKLGVIRTQELLAARRTDGGIQFFSRANDFGYSKHPDETFNIWDKKEVLSDFVWVFRKFKPDIIITRFNTTPGTTHGHHTASAVLAQEAFKLSGDSTAYPEQLEYVDLWQPKKLFWNTSWWFFRNSGQKMDTAGLTTVNVGKYNPLLGKSYTEISSLSRSMHKSQGFGSTGRRGDAIEYLVQWEGSDSKNPFDDIDTSWDRVGNDEGIKYFMKKLKAEFDPINPQEVLPLLMQLKSEVTKIDHDFWREIKLAEIDRLIKSVSGLFVELVADANAYASGDSITISLEAINRSAFDMRLESVQLNHWYDEIELKSPLVNNRKFNTSINLRIPNSIKYSSPYWLTESSTLGMYRVPDQENRGKPENEPAIIGKVNVRVGEEQISYQVPVVFKKNDPVEGEVYEPVAFTPPVMANLSGSVFVFGDSESKKIDVRLIAGKNNVDGTLSLDVPKNWKSEPEMVDYNLQRKGEEAIYSFEVTPSRKASEGEITVVINFKNKTYQKGLTEIVYDHIPKQSIFPEAKARVVRLDLSRKGERIGYIEGAGDAIPENLSGIGYTVDFLEKDDVTEDRLRNYDAIILGVRALNTVDWLTYKNVELFNYVKAGGTLISQYNTSHRLVTKEIAPYDLKLSRDRVTVEEAPVTILAKDHPVIEGPNRITEDDFNGWVQERGLYFPDEWAQEFTPILSSNDPGETPKNGGLLIARYGEGHYVYSGYSWFRNLPAGVPGAYRLFVNLISLGND